MGADFQVSMGEGWAATGSMSPERADQVGVLMLMDSGQHFAHTIKLSEKAGTGKHPEGHG